MDINWKHLATTPGYKSLKEAYASDIKKNWRGKQESLRKFQWVLCRAKHYAHHTGRTIEEILNEWESKRDYWWLNYYQDSNQPKFHSNSKKPMAYRGLRNYYKKNIFYRNLPIKAGKRAMDELHRDASTNKQKSRWTMKRKKREKRLRS